MAKTIKLFVTLTFLFYFGSCSDLLRDSLKDSKHILNNNKGKEQWLKLEITMPNDTLYADERSFFQATAKITYIGEEWYYFENPPLRSRMDMYPFMPNSVYRSFYHKGNPCRIVDENILLMPDERGSKDNWHYKLRPGKSIDLDCSFDAKKLRYGNAVWDEDNTEFGEYEMQLVLITELNDTIRSEKARFWYLEK